MKDEMIKTNSWFIRNWYLIFGIKDGLSWVRLVFGKDLWYICYNMKLLKFLLSGKTPKRYSIKMAALLMRNTVVNRFAYQNTVCVKHKGKRFQIRALVIFTAFFLIQIYHICEKPCQSCTIMFFIVHSNPQKNINMCVHVFKW